MFQSVAMAFKALGSGFAGASLRVKTVLIGSGLFCNLIAAALSKLRVTIAIGIFLDFKA